MFMLPAALYIEIFLLTDQQFHVKCNFTYIIAESRLLASMLLKRMLVYVNLYLDT